MSINKCLLGVGLAGLGALLSAGAVQGAELGGVNLLEGTAGVQQAQAQAQAPVAAPAVGAGAVDVGAAGVSGWMVRTDVKPDGGETKAKGDFFAGSPASRVASKQVSTSPEKGSGAESVASGGSGGDLPLVEMPAGIRPVTPGYALMPDAPRNWVTAGAKSAVAMQAAAPQAVEETKGKRTGKYAGYVSRRERGELRPVFVHTTTAPTGLTANNLPSNNTWGSPYQGQTPPGYQGPQTYNTFTGLSSYSNGYAGAPPSPVPFSGGLFQSRSAYYSQAPMTVPGIPVGGGGYAGYNGGNNGGGGGGGGGGGRGNQSSTNVNVLQNLQSGYRGY